MPGVVSTVVGYSGGKEPYPTYRNIKDYTEAIRIEYDPKQITYMDILGYFFSQHSITSPPYSNQYKSCVLFHDDEQRMIASMMLEGLSKKVQNRKIYTQLQDVSTTEFYKAEEYHQHYVEKQTSRGGNRW